MHLASSLADVMEVGSTTFEGRPQGFGSFVSVTLK